MPSNTLCASMKSSPWTLIFEARFDSDQVNSMSEVYIQNVVASKAHFQRVNDQAHLPLWSVAESRSGAAPCYADLIGIDAIYKSGQ